MNTIYIAIVAVILYLVVGAMLALRLSKGASTTSKTKPLLLAALGAVLLHTVVLYQELFAGGGLNLGFFNAMSLLGWLIALLVLAASMGKPVENLGIAAFPLAAIALLLEIFLPSQHLVPVETPLGLRAHIVISILAYSLFSGAAAQAVLLAVQERHLHAKRPGGFIRALPPLETMETLLFQMIGLGFVLQTLSLVTGAAFVEDMFAQHLVHKTVLSIFAWLTFAILLAGRWRFGWRGRTAIRWTLSGFIALLLSYLGSKLVLEVLLGHTA